LGGDDAERLIALKETGAGGVDAGFGVAWDGGVAIDDEIAMRDDGARADLCVERSGCEE